MKIVAEIPARYGSKRVKNKNLRLMDGYPLVYYAINAAKNSKRINEVYVNTESDRIGQIAIDNGVKYYKRNQDLAQDTITSDQFNYDFMKHVDTDIVVMVNPVAPLITWEDVDQMVYYYLNNNIDTLIPVYDVRLHAFCGKSAVNFSPNAAVQSFCEQKPINFDPSGPLPMTQNILPVRICAWTVCIWNKRIFMKAFEEKGHAVFSGKVGLYPQDRYKSIKVSNEEDFVLAEILMKNEEKWRIKRVMYDSQNVSSEYPEMWLSEISQIEKVLLDQAKENKELSILEWGSGRSTIYFPKFLRKHKIPFYWSAVENFIPWHETVSAMIKETQLQDSVTCYLKSPTREERKKVQETLDMNEFLNFPFELNKKFTLILIDARRRKECLAQAVKLLATGGVVVLHDAERDDHQEALKLFKNGGEFVCENKAPVPGGIQKLWISYAK